LEERKTFRKNRATNFSILDVGAAPPLPSPRGSVGALSAPRMGTFRQWQFLFSLPQMWRHSVPPPPFFWTHPIQISTPGCADCLILSDKLWALCNVLIGRSVFYLYFSSWVLSTMLKIFSPYVIFR